jgi:uncharacterized protein YeaO (DUF488 family)
MNIALPYGIGAGLGGGDWDKIKELIEKTAKDRDIYLYKLDKGPSNDLDVYTSSIRIKDEDSLDITVKSGKKLFAPSWDLVNGFKNKDITQHEYNKNYTLMMRHSYKNNMDKWNKLLAQDKVVLQCYCKADQFCHRFILAEILEILGANYKGELRESIQET